MGMFRTVVTICVAGVAAGSAMAQETVVRPDAASPRDDAIIVTAERSNRTLQNTATSVEVLTGKDIDHTPGAQTTYDILSRIPNIVATRSANNAPAIRGIDGGGPAVGANAFFAGTRPRVNFLVDGRTLTFNEAIYIDGGIWDAQQIEVYRGPQSTLQGRNAIGGVIAIKTADPTFDWQGKVRGLIGGDDLRQIFGAVGGPLIANVAAFRIAADFRREDAQVETFPYAELKHPGRYRSLNLRGKLLITPTEMPDFRTLLTLSYTDSYAPQTLSVARPFGDYISSQTGVGNAATPRFRTRALAGIADTSWQLADGITLSNFFTGTHFLVNRYINTGNGIARIDGQEFTIEPRVRFGQASDTMSGFIAAYWLHSQQHEAIDLFGGGKFFDKTLTRAVFGEVSWKPSPLFDLTLGTRYEQENRDRTGGAGVFLIDYHKNFHAFLPKATASLHPNSDLTVGATIGHGYNSGGAGFAFNPPFPSFTYGKETVWNYEGFVRSALLGGRLNVDANIFYNDFHGLQLPFVVPGSTPAAPATVIRNADRATTYGIEGNLRFRVVKGLDLTAGTGLLKTKVNRYDDPNVQGNDLARAPAFTFNAGLSATPLPRIDISADVQYTDTYYSDVFNNARGKTKPYAIANAQIGYRLQLGARLFVSVTNLFNETTPVLINTNGIKATDGNPAIDTANMPLKRRVSGGVEFNF
jgi:outer membrane receptor protein involved in Fe transport